MSRQSQFPNDMPAKQRLLASREIGPGGCWLWTGYCHPDGYGRAVWREVPETNVHRIAWHVWRGPIPDDLCVLHRCDVRRCFNPAHLFLGTRTDNSRDRDTKGRQRNYVTVPGVVDPRSKLTVDQVRAIRADPRPQTVIAAEHGISQQNVSRIKLRLQHNHIS